MTVGSQRGERHQTATKQQSDRAASVGGLDIGYCTLGIAEEGRAPAMESGALPDGKAEAGGLGAVPVHGLNLRRRSRFPSPTDDLAPIAGFMSAD
jgi:hypothetical protein